MPTLGITEGALVLLVLDRVINIIRAVRNGNGNSKSNGNSEITHLKLFERQEETNRTMAEVAVTLKQIADILQRAVRVEIRP